MANKPCKEIANRQRPSADQMEYMYCFMEKNKAFARNELSVSSMKIMWNQLTRELNLQKGEERLMDNWRKTWHEAKVRAEQRLSMLQNNVEDVTPLSATQIRILIIIGKTSVSAMSNSTSVVGSFAASCSTQSSSINSTQQLPNIASEMSKESINSVNIPCNNEEAAVTSTSMNGLNIGEMGYLLDVPVHNVLKRKATVPNSTIIDLTNNEAERIPKKRSKGLSSNMDILLGKVSEQNETLYQFLNGIITALEEIKLAIISLKELGTIKNNTNSDQKQESPEFVAVKEEDIPDYFINLDDL